MIRPVPGNDSNRMVSGSVHFSSLDLDNVGFHNKSACSFVQ